MTNDYMLRRGDIQKILSAALTEKGIELDAKRIHELLDLFLEGEFEIDQTKQPITNQVERIAREFLFSSSARAVWNDSTHNRRKIYDRSVAAEGEIEIGYFKGEELIDFKWVTPKQLEEEIEKSKNSNITVSRIGWEESSDNRDNYKS